MANVNSRAKDVPFDMTWYLISISHTDTNAFKAKPEPSNPPVSKYSHLKPF